MWCSTQAAPAGRGGDMETIGGQTGDDPIVTNETIFPEQYGVAAPAGCQPGEIAGIETAQECRRVRPDDLDFAERAGIEHADIVPDREAFAGTAAAMVSPERGKHRARFQVPTSSSTAPGVAIGGRRTGANSAARQAPANARKSPAYRVDGTWSGRSPGWLSGQRRHGGQRVQVGRLALICRHARGGVALYVLDRDEPFRRATAKSFVVTSFWKSTKA